MPSARRLTLALYAAFIAVTAAFIVALIWQVASALYGAGSTGDAASRSLPEGRCRAGLVALRERIESAATAAATEHTDEDAMRAYHGVLGSDDPRWAEVRGACQGVPHGPEATAALARLDRAAESVVRRKSSALAPVRREVDSFIRVPAIE